MSFLEHLEELRKRLVIILVFFTIVASISFFFSWQAFSFLVRPAGDIELIYLSPIEPFVVKLKIALFSGIIFSLPIIFYQMFAFIFPALKENEKKIIWIVIASIVLFLMGCLFSFFVVLPFALKWLFSQAEGVLSSSIRAEYYIGFVCWFVFIFGFIFEAPLIVISLIKLKVCTYRDLRLKWQFVYIGILIISAVLTPDWNPVTMFLMAIPLIFLYEVSLLVGKIL
ncbi:TPA: twin-arginine translocase subunit TatC [bacterium]|nr:twin-arginine translocase subunit TatC [bacterium]